MSPEEQYEAAVREQISRDLAAWERRKSFARYMTVANTALLAVNVAFAVTDLWGGNYIGLVFIVAAVFAWDAITKSFATHEIACVSQFAARQALAALDLKTMTNDLEP